jgi:hypothetical protein
MKAIVAEMRTTRDRAEQDDRTLLDRTSIEDDDYHNQLAGKADAGDGLRVFLVCSK